MPGFRNLGSLYLAGGDANFLRSCSLAPKRHKSTNVNVAPMQCNNAERGTHPHPSIRLILRILPVGMQKVLVIIHPLERFEEHPVIIVKVVERTPSLGAGLA